jgi:hypothetical protein
MGQARVVIHEDGHELKQRNPSGPLDDKSVEDGSSGELTEDVIELARFGKKQVLRVCPSRRMTRKLTIIAAKFWTNIYDWLLLRIDVHVGRNVNVRAWSASCPLHY